MAQHSWHIWYVQSKCCDTDLFIIITMNNSGQGFTYTKNDQCMSTWKLREGLRNWSGSNPELGIDPGMTSCSPISSTATSYSCKVKLRQKRLPMVCFVSFNFPFLDTAELITNECINVQDKSSVFIILMTTEIRIWFCLTLRLLWLLRNWGNYYLEHACFWIL